MIFVEEIWRAVYDDKLYKIYTKYYYMMLKS